MIILTGNNTEPLLDVCCLELVWHQSLEFVVVKFPIPVEIGMDKPAPNVLRLLGRDLGQNFVHSVCLDTLCQFSNCTGHPSQQIQIHVPRFLCRTTSWNCAQVINSWALICAHTYLGMSGSVWACVPVCLCVCVCVCVCVRVCVRISTADAIASMSHWTCESNRLEHLCEQILPNMHTLCVFSMGKSSVAVFAQFFLWSIFQKWQVSQLYYCRLAINRHLGCVAMHTARKIECVLATVLYSNVWIGLISGLQPTSKAGPQQVRLRLGFFALAAGLSSTPFWAIGMPRQQIRW